MNMKLRLIAVLAALVVVSACQMQANWNGVAVTAEEQAVLDSLRPQAEALVAQSTDGTASGGDQSALVAGLTSLLQGAFGSGYSKFVQLSAVSQETPVSRSTTSYGPNEDANCVLRKQINQYEFPWGTIEHYSAYVFQKHAQVSLDIQHMRITAHDRSTGVVKVMDTYGKTSIDLWSNWKWGWFPVIFSNGKVEAWDTRYIVQQGYLWDDWWEL